MNSTLGYKEILEETKTPQYFLKNCKQLHLHTIVS